MSLYELSKKEAAEQTCAVPVFSSRSLGTKSYAVLVHLVEEVLSEELLSS